MLFSRRLTRLLGEQSDVMSDDLRPLHDGQRESYVGHVPLREQGRTDQPSAGQDASERGQSRSALACGNNVINTQYYHKQSCNQSIYYGIR